MDVVRDLFDALVVDRNGREMGRVDGVLFEQDAGPPQLTAILIGPSVLGSRLHPALGRLANAVERRLGVEHGRPVRIDLSQVDEIDGRVKLRVSIGDTAAAAIEQRLRTWLLKLPGSR